MVLAPQNLKTAKRIAVITPAGAVEIGQLDSTLLLLQERGFTVSLGPHVYSKFEDGYNYAGNAQERLEDLQWALDGNFDVIWTTRGGYGSVQLLQNIDLRKFRKRPKLLIGYSDVTVLQSFLFKKGFGSIHGQSIKTASFGVDQKAYEKIFDILNGKMPSYTFQSNAKNRKGNVTGILVGGNLAMLYSIMGSRFSYDYSDKILFIEDVGEQYYAIDRMLMAFEICGVFKKIKGLIVGGMTRLGEENSNTSYHEPFDPLAYKIVAERVEKYRFPVAFGMPNGHIFENFPLVIGNEVTLTVGKETSLIFH